MTGITGGYGNSITNIAETQPFALIPGYGGLDTYVPAQINFETGEVTDLGGNVLNPNSLVYSLPSNAVVRDHIGG